MSAPHRWIAVAAVDGGAAALAPARAPPWLGATHLALLAALVGLAWSVSLDAPFVFDDLHNIVLNPAVHAARAGDLWRVLTSPVSGDRPLALATFALNFLHGRLDPWGYHAVNVAVHAVNAWLVYRLGVRLLGAAGAGAREAPPGAIRHTAFWAAAIWALDPVQTQAVTYVVQRMTSLAALFYLAGLLAFVAWREGRIGGRAAALAVGACFVLGMACKPIVVTLPLALALLDALLWPRPGSRRAGLAFAAAAAVVALAGLAWLGGRLPDPLAAYPGRGFSPVERLLTEPRVLWHYVSLFVLPWPERLHLAYEVEVSRGLLRPATTLAALGAWAAVAGLAWRLRRRRPLATLAIGFFLLASSVEASFLDLELAFEHRIYLPSAFLALGVLGSLPAAPVRRAGPVLAVLVGALALGTVTRNAEWRSAAGVWDSAPALGGDTARTRLNRAMELNVLGRGEEAAAAIAAAGDAAGPVARYELALAHQLAGRYAEAEPILDALVAAHGPQPAFVLRAALGKLELGRTDEARALAARLRERRPDHPFAAVVDARARLLAGDPAAAAAILGPALAGVAPGNVQMRTLLRLHLADALLALGRPREAYRRYLEVIDESPETHLAWLQIHRMQMAAGDTANAARIRRYLESRGVAVPQAAAPR